MTIFNTVHLLGLGTHSNLITYGRVGSLAVADQVSCLWPNFTLPCVRCNPLKHLNRNSFTETRGAGNYYCSLPRPHCPPPPPSLLNSTYSTSTSFILFILLNVCSFILTDYYPILFSVSSPEVMIFVSTTPEPPPITVLTFAERTSSSLLFFFKVQKSGMLR